MGSGEILLCVLFLVLIFCEILCFINPKLAVKLRLMPEKSLNSINKCRFIWFIYCGFLIILFFSGIFVLPENYISN